MRWFTFIPLMIGALLFSLWPLPALLMTECQLNDNEAAIRLCFEKADHTTAVYFGTVAACLIAAIAIQIGQSKWAGAGVLALLVCPTATLFLM